MPKFYTTTALISLLSLAPAKSANLRSRRIAFDNDLLTLAAQAWVENPQTANDRFGHISEWDVSLVFNMSGLFANALDFNEDLSLWNVSNVRDMRHTFANASSFGGNLSTWNVSSVIYTSHMFHGALSFDSDVSGWNTTNVRNFSYMFAGASSFHGDVSTWDVTGAYDLSFMFLNATSFDGDVSQWTIEKHPVPGIQYKWVQNMQSMFQGASSFNGNVSQWHTYATYDMNSMFKDATSFSGDVSGWDVRHVRDFREMFAGSAFDQVLCWNVQAGADTTNMFNGTLASLGEDCKDETRGFPELDARTETPASSTSAARPGLRAEVAIALSVAVTAIFFGGRWR
jgi:surface protein